MGTHHIAVIGAGLMWQGIALTFARKGNPVTITDPVEAARANVQKRIADSLDPLGDSGPEIARALERVTVCETLPDAVAGADVVFAAAPEKLELKQKIFAEVEAAAPRKVILASNTSVMPITKIMADLQHKTRALGT